MPFGSAVANAALAPEALALLDRLPSPNELQSPQAVLDRAMSEAGFVDWALTYVGENARVCLLDSAGPTHVRAGRAVLSGNLRGMFVQNADAVTFEDFSSGTAFDMPVAVFESWLAVFTSADLGPTGPCLFPLLTYEAFNPYIAPARPHPLWREGQAIWLLAEDRFVYDRERGRLLGPAKVSTPPAYPRERDLETPLGWREEQSVYHDSIQRLLRDIHDGNFYQANLSQRFLGESDANPLETYRRLRKLNPSPFMGIFRLGDVWVLSGSPERLANRQGERISARPIAGTRPRYRDVLRDDASQRELVESPKERAEHVMLLDLIRNDLGRIAKPGSVEVTEYAHVETYSHVHHLVSQVEAEASAKLTPAAFISAVFPGGTITGAPKIACMQRLVELEGEARGPYTGSMGMFDTSRDWDLNILIRTVIQTGRHVCFHGGGGIVADSRDQAEYDETRHKCQALMEALQIRC